MADVKRVLQKVLKKKKKKCLKLKIFPFQLQKKKSKMSSPLQELCDKTVLKTDLSKC